MQMQLFTLDPLIDFSSRARNTYPCLYTRICTCFAVLKAGFVFCYLYVGVVGWCDGPV